MGRKVHLLAIGIFVIIVFILSVSIRKERGIEKIYDSFPVGYERKIDLLERFRTDSSCVEFFDISNKSNKKYNEAVILYELGEYDSQYYDSSLIVIQSLISDTIFCLEYHFYEGLNYLGKSNINNRLNYNQKAITSFSSVVKGKDLYYSEALWYLGLTYLKIGNRKKAKEQFESLSRFENQYMLKSKVLLNKYL